ncbi:MAG: DUF4406 domain-containing protein [bacterium]|nr:DUF4406 domain-containing protein [bacterium]
MSDEVKTVYIAGPITGDPDYKHKFKAAEFVMRNKGFIVLNPAAMFASLDKQNASWETIMSVGLNILQMADRLALLPDWKDSRGSLMELGAFMSRNADDGIIYEFQELKVNDMYGDPIPGKYNVAERRCRDYKRLVEKGFIVIQKANDAHIADNDVPKQERMFGTDKTECVGNEPIPRDIIGSLCAAAAEEVHGHWCRLNPGIQEMLDKYGYVYKDYEGKLYYDGKAVCTIDGLIYGS